MIKVFIVFALFAALACGSTQQQALPPPMPAPPNSTEVERLALVQPDPAAELDSLYTVLIADGVSSVTVTPAKTRWSRKQGAVVTDPDCAESGFFSAASWPATTGPTLPPVTSQVHSHPFQVDQPVTIAMAGSGPRWLALRLNNGAGQALCLRGERQDSALTEQIQEYWCFAAQHPRTGECAPMWRGGGSPNCQGQDCDWYIRLAYSTHSPVAVAEQRSAIYAPDKPQVVLCKDIKDAQKRKRCEAEDRCYRDSHKRSAWQMTKTEREAAWTAYQKCVAKLAYPKSTQ